ncbi:heavy metal translocating P-type ATPase [Treponema parvum]|uniref:P-type Zn(2+) transporter n=1 Tax=Treponema parvum TaxID=138851 RepID=A0A975F0K9_9SPIR|nr:heavy metal translocating P-type ATPase [Treponema parvum]QTQ12172.1 heavy metal translocating P-type ATPase [Treponema parvum]QTQ15838.1 heavy metal translocating P-type ATPase [Treponema parvum]
MNFYIKHSLPGRIRVGYNKDEISSHQAALARQLLCVQEGMIKVTVNCVTAAFLIYYDESVLSQKKIEALFAALSDKYLCDEEMLSSVEEPVKDHGLWGALFAMTANHYIRRLFPPSIRLILNVAAFLPRIFKGMSHVARGDIFNTSVLDATAITMAAVNGDMNTASNINFLLNVGEAIETFTKKRSYDNLAHTMLNEHEQVRLVEGDTERSVPLYMLKTGDTVAVRTGAVIPADGDVIKGEALINQASITGEPLAVEKRERQSVFAGTIVQEGELFIRVRAVGSQTKVQNILAMIDSSQSLKVSSQIRSENLANTLVKYNFLLSLLVFVATRDITKVMATLMVDYSCAMKLASPIAVLSAMKEASEHGILVKGGKFLEEASHADTVVFDKTGTLTAAVPKLSRVIPFGNLTESQVLTIAACLEEHFIHPVSRAIVQAAADRKLKHRERHAKVEYVVAHGIATTMDGKKLIIGSRHFVFEDERVAVPENMERIQKEAVDRGESLLYLAEDGQLLGVLAVTDPVRKDAERIIELLHENGVTTCAMITGDDEGAAKTAAKAAKIDFYIFRALPEDKVSYIKKQKEAGHKVLMIGDGINDAPALATADIGVAMGDCADITSATADIVLSSENGLSDLLTTRVLGQRLLEKIDRNNRGIVAVNSVLIMAGLAGILSPALAAVLHNLSTVLFSAVAAKSLLGNR